MATAESQFINRENVSTALVVENELKLLALEIHVTSGREFFYFF